MRRLVTRRVKIPEQPFFPFAVVYIEWEEWTDEDVDPFAIPGWDLT